MKHCHFLIIFLFNLSSSFAISLDSLPIQTELNNNYALLFAIEEYDYKDSWQTLPNTIKATKEIAEELKVSYGFNTEVVKNPTKTEILEKISQYAEIDYGKYGQLLVYFSGHGHIKEKGKKRKIGFLVTKDTKSVEDDKQFESYLRHTTFAEELNYLESCRHILVLIDACFSSTFDSELNNADTRADPKRTYSPNKKSMQEFQKEELEYTSRLFLASGNKETLAGNKYAYSPFSNTFLSALRDDNLRKEGIIIFDALKGYFKNARLNPRPKGGYFGDHEAGGNFLLVRQAKTPKIRNDVLNVKSQANIGLFEREDYQLRKDMQIIWSKFNPFFHNVFNETVDDYLGEEDFRVASYKGNIDEALHKNSKLIIKSLLYSEMMFPSVIGLKYESPYFSFEYDGETFYESLSLEEINWTILEMYFKQKIIEKSKNVFNK